jgi:hypothetical protein
MHSQVALGSIVMATVLDVHLFQPLRTQRQWIDRTFALHCLKFLRQNLVSEHNQFFSEALVKDESRS